MATEPSVSGCCNWQRPTCCYWTIGAWRASTASPVLTCWKSLMTGPPTRPPSSPANYPSTIGMRGSQTLPSPTPCWIVSCSVITVSPWRVTLCAEQPKSGNQEGNQEARFGPTVNSRQQSAREISHAVAPFTTAGIRNWWLDWLLQPPAATPGPGDANPCRGLCFSSLACAETAGSIQKEGKYQTRDLLNRRRRIIGCTCLRRNGL